MALSLKSYCCWCLRGGGGGRLPHSPPPFKQKMLIFFPTRVTRGLLLGILGGDVPPGSPNLDPISDQKISFSTPVFRPGIQNPYPF